MKPAIRLLGKGVIEPQSGNVPFPFEAVNLRAVEVKIIQIFEINILQFLQTNQLDHQFQLRRVGRLVHKESVELLSDKPLDYGKRNTFSLDLSEFITPESGAIYCIEIGFTPQFSLYPCDEPIEQDDILEDKTLEQELSYWDNPNSYDNDYEYYNWNERDNPCNKAYYVKRRNVASNVFSVQSGYTCKIL